MCFYKINKIIVIFKIEYTVKIPKQFYVLVAAEKIVLRDIVLEIVERKPNFAL